MQRLIQNTTKLVATLILVISSGCYNSDSLVEEVRNRSIRTRLDEVDLGYFRTTLPREASQETGMEIEAELFGTTNRYKIPELEQLIEKENYRLRQAIVVALRQTTANEMADPNLVTFRERLMQVANEILVEMPIESLGFRRIRFIPL